MGAYAPAPVPYAADELAGDVRPAGARPLRGGRHAVRRRALRRADAHRRRPAPRRVQRPLRRPRGPGRAAAAATPTSPPLALAATARPTRPPSPLDVAPGAACTVVAAAAGYPAAPRTRRPVLTTLADAERPQLDGRAAVPRRDGRRRHERRAGARRHRARRRPRRRRGTPPTRRWPSVSSTGCRCRRDIGWRAPGAALPSYAAAGVDIDEGNRAVAQMKAAVERTHGAEVVRGVGSFGGVFSAKAIAAMDDPVLVASTDGVGTKVELAARLGRVARRRARHRQPLHRRRARAGGPAAVLPRLHRRQHARRRPRRRGRHRAWPRRARRPAARCSAARRPRCPASTRRARSTSPARSSASPSGPTLLPRADVAAGDVLDRRRVERPAHQRLLAAAQAVRVDPDGRRPGRPRPPARRRPARAAPQLPRRAARRRSRPAASRRSPTSPAAACPRTCRGCCPPASTPASSSARGRCRRCSGSCASWPPALDDHELHRTLNMGIGMVVVCAPDDVDACGQRSPRRRG